MFTRLHFTFADLTLRMWYLAVRQFIDGNGREGALGEQEPREQGLLEGEEEDEEHKGEPQSDYSLTPAPAHSVGHASACDESDAGSSQS